MTEVVVALLAVAVAVNLLLTWAMIRRLRQLQASVTPVELPAAGPRVGDVVPDVPLTTEDGASVVMSEVLRGESLLAFLSPECSSCIDELPALRRTALAAESSGSAVVVVVEGFPQRSGVILEAMTGAAPVLFADRSESSFLDDLDVQVFPSLCVVDSDRRVVEVPPSLHSIGLAV